MKSFKKFKNLTLSCSIRFLIIICLFSCELISSQLAQGESKFLGNIGLGRALNPKPLPQNYMDYWNQLSPENASKWSEVEISRDVYDWSQVDLLYNFCQTNNIPFKWHTALWKKSEPAWIQGLSNVEIREEVEEWISDFMARYPNTQYIEVINEFIIHDDGATEAIKNAFGGNGNTGLDWAIAIHQLARLYAPNAVLIANDYTILSNNSNTQTMTNKVAILNNAGVIDAIGCQSHFLETVPGADLTQRLTTLASSGLDVFITEYDVNEPNDVLQRAIYQDQFPAMWEHPAVKGVTLWGYIQPMFRINGWLYNPTTNTERPALVWLKGYFNTTIPPPSSLNEFRLENKARGKWLQNLTTPDSSNSTICGGIGTNVRGVNTTKTGDATKWELVPANADYFYIRNVARNNYLQLAYDVSPDLSGNESCGLTFAVRGVSAGLCVGDWTQWKLIEAGTGYSRLENKGNGYWLQMPDITDIDDGSLDGGLQVRAVSNCKTGDATRWKLRDVMNSAALKVSIIDEFTIQDDHAGFYAYPNPSSTSIWIETGLESKEQGSLALRDFSGRILNTVRISTKIYEMDMSNYSPGIYFVSINTSAGKKTKKIIKE